MDSKSLITFPTPFIDPFLGSIKMKWPREPRTSFVEPIFFYTFKQIFS